MKKPQRFGASKFLKCFFFAQLHTKHTAASALYRRKGSCTLARASAKIIWRKNLEKFKKIWRKPKEIWRKRAAKKLGRPNFRTRRSTSEPCCFLALDVMLTPQAERYAGKQVDLTTHRSGARPHNGKQNVVCFSFTVTRNACRRSGFFRFGYRQPPRPKSRVRVVSS